MKKIFYLYSKSLLSKLALMAILIVGGGSSAWAETTIFAGARENGWTYKTGGSTAYVAGGLLTSSSTSDVRTYSSDNKITISSCQKIILSAKYYSNSNKTSAYIKIKLSTDNENWNETTFSETNGDLTANYQTLTLADITPNDYYIQFEFVYSQIQSIVLKDPMSITTNTVTFGNCYANTSQVVSVSNDWLDNLNVNISNSNTTDFTISETSLNDISNGSSKTFSISFNYNPSSTGNKSATITITPTFLGAVSQTITVSANAINNSDPVLTVTPTNISAGNITSQNTKSFKVKNTGGQEMSVNITSNNTEYFTVSPSSISNIIYGSDQTVTITCNYPSIVENLGLHEATITITPTYNPSDAKEISVSATATPYYTFNEDNSSSWSTGSRSFIFKYQPSNGWNTIIVPFTLNSTNIQTIFGSSAKTYELNTYSDGVLGFKTVSSWSNSNNKPFLVYTNNAPNNSEGILFNVYISTASTTTAGNVQKNGATFQGTYTPITAGNFTDNMYGVTSSGQVRPGDGVNANMKGYRAYFTGISAPSTPGARISIVFEDDGETTDLGFVKMVDPEATDVYTLSGQKVKKGGKGIYIVNGRKVVIK